MKKFDIVINEIFETITKRGDLMGDTMPQLPSYKQKPNDGVGAKYSANDQGKIAGKYRKGVDNVEGSMVSDRDRAAGTEKGQLKTQMDGGGKIQKVVMSQMRFNRLLNQSGERSIDLSDGQEKIVNSKDGELTVTLLGDGRVSLVRRP